jgi:hypothetical protein
MSPLMMVSVLRSRARRSLNEEIAARVEGAWETSALVESWFVLTLVTSYSYHTVAHEKVGTGAGK